MIVVVDDPGRENEGDLVMAASRVTPAAINFMATHGRGLICVPLLSGRLSQLGIPPMVPRECRSRRTYDDRNLSQRSRGDRQGPRESR